jgi:hypothetical protein
MSQLWSLLTTGDAIVLCCVFLPFLAVSRADFVETTETKTSASSAAQDQPQLRILRPARSLSNLPPR